MGNKIKNIGRSTYTAFISILGGGTSLAVVAMIIFQFISIKNGTSNVRFNGDIRIIYGMTALLAFISLFFLVFFIWAIPKYTFKVYENGIEIKGKNVNNSMLYSDIEEFFYVPHFYGFPIAIGFKSAGSNEWYYMDNKNSNNGIKVLNKAYTNSIYPILSEQIKNGKTLRFNYFEKSKLTKRKYLGGKIVKFLNGDKNTIKLNTETISFGNNVFKISDIDKIKSGKLTSKYSLISKEGKELLNFPPLSISKESCFISLLEDLIG